LVAFDSGTDWKEDLSCDGLPFGFLDGDGELEGLRALLRSGREIGGSLSSPDPLICSWVRFFDYWLAWLSFGGVGPEL
jgi:hypothetical protein